MTINDNGLSRFLRTLQSQLDNPKPINEAIGLTVRERIRQCFATSQAPDGTAWKPLVSRDGQPLLNTGKHMRDNTSYLADSEGVTVGNGFKYADVHQYGATIRPVTASALRFKLGGKLVSTQKVTIPARPFIPDALADDWQEDVADVIVQKVTIPARPFIPDDLPDDWQEDVADVIVQKLGK